MNTILQLKEQQGTAMPIDYQAPLSTVPTGENQLLEHPTPAQPCGVEIQGDATGVFAAIQPFDPP